MHGSKKTSTKSIQIIAKNTATSSVTINQVWINGAKQDYSPQTFQSNTPIGITVNYDWITNAKYEIKLVSAKGHPYIYIVKATTQPVATQWLTGWNYRKSHIIDGTASTAGAEYQIKITAHYGSGTDSGENVYLENKAKTDFGDVRFVQSDNNTLLSYWLEKIDGTTATFWVKIAGNLTAQFQTIYVYYGNNQTTTTSNGETTFTFFDDFSSDLTKWAKEKNGDHIYINSGHLVLDGGTTSSPYGHTVLGSSVNYSTFHDGIIEADIFPSNNALPEIGFRGIYNSNMGYKARWDCRSGSESPWMKPPYNGWNGFGTSITRCGISNQWQKIKIEVTGSTFKMYSNDELKSTVVDGQYDNEGEISLQNHYGTSCFFDNVRVRKSAIFEPIQTLWGAEEAH